MLAAKIDRPIRHADVLSKYPGVSCQSSLHLNNRRRRRRRRWCCVEMQRRCRQPRSPLGGQGHRCGLREPGRRRRLEPNRGPRRVRPVLTRTTSKLYFRRAVYVCGGHELSDEKRSVRSWITNVIHQILPFSSDESRIRRRCVGGLLALVTKTVADLRIWAHLRPVSDYLRPACCRDSGRTVSTLMHLPAVMWR